MTAKNKEPHRFTVGDKAKVRNIHTGEIVNQGEVIFVEPLGVRFKSSRQEYGHYYFRRESDKWIERRRNQYELIDSK